MAKLRVFLVFALLEFSRQDDFSAIKKQKNVLVEFEFPKQQIIQEMYPSEVMLENIKKNTSESIETAEIFFQPPQNSLETASNFYDDLWDDYFDVILDVEDWMIKAHPDLNSYLWLKILQEGSVTKGNVPECSDKLMRIDKNQSSGLDFENDNVKLIEKYNQLISIIEKWMVKAKPSMRNYKWLEVVEKGIILSCFDYDTDSYEYYYDTDIANLLNDEDLLQMNHPAVGEPKFKRFTSV